MNADILYFTGTGNTLALAKKLNSKLDCNIKSIVMVVNNQEYNILSKTLIIMFPSYIAPVSGYPLVVDTLLEGIKDIQSYDIYAVCNCGGYESVNAAVSLERFRKQVKKYGGKCRGLYTLRMPMNNLDYDHIPIPIERDTEVILRKADVSIALIAAKILNRRKSRWYLRKLFFLMFKPMEWIIKPIVLKDLRNRAKINGAQIELASTLIPMTDKSIEVFDTCNNCGVCEKVCPVKNIQLVDGKPQFNHHCEMCYACDEWCPSGAIHHWSREKGTKYRNPEVTLKDMINQKDQ